MMKEAVSTWVKYTGSMLPKSPRMKKKVPVAKSVTTDRTSPRTMIS